MVCWAQLSYPCSCGTSCCPRLAACDPRPCRPISLLWLLSAALALFSQGRCHRDSCGPHTTAPAYSPPRSVTQVRTRGTCARL